MKTLPFFFAPADGLGAGGSGGTGGGQPAGQGGGSPAGGTGQPGAGGSPSAIKLTDDMLVDPGDGSAPVPYGQYRQSRYMPVDQYNKGVEFLTNIAKTLDAQQRNGRQQPQRQQPQQPQADPLDAIWSQPLIDGAALKQLYQQGLGPIARAIQQQQQVIQQLQQQLGKVGGHVGSVIERTSGEDYNRQLDSAISGLGLPGFDPNHEELKPLMPFLREFAQDVFDSHDPNDKNYTREMPGIFKSRVENAIKFVRALDKVRIAQAKTQRRVFTRPGGQVTPGQPNKYKFENSREVASRLFGSVENPT